MHRSKTPGAPGQHYSCVFVALGGLLSEVQKIFCIFSCAIKSVPTLDSTFYIQLFNSLQSPLPAA